MKTKRKIIAALVGALLLVGAPIGVTAASAIQDQGDPYNGYLNPNPPTSPIPDSIPWVCFQWGPGPAPGASAHKYIVWCPKGVFPGTIYGSDGVKYGEVAWTNCGNGYPKDHMFNDWSCNATWKSYPYPTSF